MLLSRLLITATLAVAALAVPVTAAASPPGLQDVTRFAPRTAAGVEPTMYPPAEKVLWSATGVRSQRCETGTLCVDVWDPTRATFKVFIMRRCVTRALHDFHETGTTEFINHQTPGTVTRFLGRGGDVLVRSTAPSYTTPISWGPVWYIDVC